jgi:hypothetical protein
MKVLRRVSWNWNARSRRRSWQSLEASSGPLNGETRFAHRLPALHHGEGPPHKLRDGNVIAVMDGEIDGFIQAYLKWSVTGS